MHLPTLRQVVLFWIISLPLACSLLHNNHFFLGIFTAPHQVGLREWHRTTCAADYNKYESEVTWKFVSGLPSCPLYPAQQEWSFWNSFQEEIHTKGDILLLPFPNNFYDEISKLLALFKFALQTPSTHIARLSVEHCLNMTHLYNSANIKQHISKKSNWHHSPHIFHREQYWGHHLTTTSQGLSYFSGGFYLVSRGIAEKITASDHVESGAETPNNEITLGSWVQEINTTRPVNYREKKDLILPYYPPYSLTNNSCICCTPQDKDLFNKKMLERESDLHLLQTHIASLHPKLTYEKYFFLILASTGSDFSAPLWEKFLEKVDEERYMVFVHCKEREKCVPKFEGLSFKVNFVETVPSQWCYDLASPMISLLKPALFSSGSIHDQFFFVSDTGIPVKPFEDFSRILKHKIQGTCVAHTGGFFHHDNKIYAKAHQWVSLSQSEAFLVLRRWRMMKEQNIYIPGCLDETFFTWALYNTSDTPFPNGSIPMVSLLDPPLPTLISNKNGSTGFCSTFVYWAESATHSPCAEGDTIHKIQEKIPDDEHWHVGHWLKPVPIAWEILRNSSFLFARKFTPHPEFYSELTHILYD